MGTEECILVGRLCPGRIVTRVVRLVHLVRPEATATSIGVGSVYRVVYFYNVYCTKKNTYYCY